MEEKKRNQNSSIALVAIAKNEEHCITRMIASAIPYVSLVVLHDTGSSDRTIEFAKEVCDGANVPFLYVKTNDWKGFAHARNVALNKLGGMTDYVLQLDADEVIHVNKMPELDADLIGIYITNLEEMALGGRIYKSNMRLDGKIHEYIKGTRTFSHTDHRDIYIEHIHDGARSIVKPDDIKAIEEAYKETNELRYLYYMGETLMSQRKWQDAAYFFIRRTREQQVYGFDEERYLAMYRAGMCLYMLDRKSGALSWFLEAFRMAQRVEPATYAMQIFNDEGAHYMACDIGSSVKSIEHKGLVIDPSIWDWGFYYEYFSAAKHLRSPQKAVELAKILTKSNAPKSVKDSVKSFL